MAVKIISTVPDKSVVKQVICQNCGATLEFVPLDVMVYRGRDIGGGPSGTEWIDCPNCTKQVILNSW